MVLVLTMHLKNDLRAIQTQHQKSNSAMSNYFQQRSVFTRFALDVAAINIVPFDHKMTQWFSTSVEKIFGFFLLSFFFYSFIPFSFFFPFLHTEFPTGPTLAK